MDTELNCQTVMILWLADKAVCQDDDDGSDGCNDADDADDADVANDANDADDVYDDNWKVAPWPV